VEQCSAKARAQSVRHFRRMKRQNCPIQQILLALEQLGNEQEEGQGKKEGLKPEINAPEEGQGKKEAFVTSQVRAVLCCASFLVSTAIDQHST